jgi:SAM-dependent methyltransferase
MEESRLKCRVPGQRHPDWEALYQGNDPKTLPWHYEPLDPELAQALERRRISGGTLLDLGTGSGAQAFELHQLGFEVIGSDLSASAVERARRSYPTLCFEVDDILHTPLAGPFHYIFDRGCFHVLPQSEQDRFARTAASLLAPGGLLFLKCFSMRQPEADFGPLRFSREDLLRVFGPYFHAEEIRACRFQGNTPNSPYAFFAVFRKKGAE